MAIDKRQTIPHGGLTTITGVSKYGNNLQKMRNEPEVLVTT